MAKVNGSQSVHLATPKHHWDKSNKKGMCGVERSGAESYKVG